MEVWKCFLVNKEDALGSVLINVELNEKSQKVEFEGTFHKDISSFRDNANQDSLANELDTNSIDKGATALERNEGAAHGTNKGATLGANKGVITS